MLAPYYDGDFTRAMQSGPWRVEQPFPFQPDTQIRRAQFVVLSEFFAASPADSPLTLTPEALTNLTGTFTITFNGSTTSALNVYASALDVQNALNALAGVVQGAYLGYTVVTGDFLNGYLVKFRNSGTGRHYATPLMQLNTAGISPATTANVTRTTGAKSGQYWEIQKILIGVFSAQAFAGFFLIEETPTSDMGGGGLVSFDRAYANVPRPWYEFPAYTYQCQRAQFYRIAWSGASGVMAQYYGPVVYRTFIALAEWSEPLIATVRHKYALIPEGTKNIEAKIGAMIPYRVIHIQDSFGRDQVFVIGTYGVAEPTSAKRWRGNIFEVVDTFVNPFIPAGP